MLSGLEYLFSEKDLRLFLRGRTIKTIKPIVEDDEPVEFHFTDGYKIRMKHKPRALGKGVYTPYFTVEVIQPSGQVLLQNEIKKLNHAEGKLQPLKKEAVKPYIYKRKDSQGIRMVVGDRIRFKIDGKDYYDIIKAFTVSGLIKLESDTKLRLIPKEVEFLNSADVRPKKKPAVKLESKADFEKGLKKKKESKVDKDKRLGNEYQNLSKFILTGKTATQRKAGRSK